MPTTTDGARNERMDMDKRRNQQVRANERHRTSIHRVWSECGDDVVF
jgi:hypothetical protein